MLKHLFIALTLVTFLQYCSARPRDKRMPRSSVNGQPGNNSTLFSDWSDWSKCSRQCRQFRRRFCLKPDKCESRTQKLFRACHSSKCRNKLLVMANPGTSKERPSKSRIMLHLQRYLYSEWSGWSECSATCHTKRTRTCRLPDICGKNYVQEDYKSCFREGDICEKLYLESLKHLPGFNFSTPTTENKAHPLDNIKCGIPAIMPDLKIVGGRRAVKDSWPWQALIFNKYWEPFCGGALLSDTWVLTAAHCVRKKLRVRVGEFDLTEIEGSEQEEVVEAAYVYPDYDPETVENDLALLKLRKPFILNDHVQPVCLPETDEELPLYARATILGWGKRRNEATFGTDILHQAEVPVVPPDECRDSYDDYSITDSMICAGYDRGRVDSCSGDSGGPLLYKSDRNSRWTVYGVTSFGDGCGERGKFGVYANVPLSVNWIKYIISVV